jgi:hypothetical protein
MGHMKKHMQNGMLIVGTLLLLAAPVQGEENSLYRANELSMDLFGSASLQRHTIDNISRARVQQNTRLGMGAGINYFFTQNMGISADAYAEDTKGSVIDSSSVSFTYRFPLGQSGFAPYAFGGGGRHFENVRTWFAQVGAGVEYRFSPQIGIFLDARGVVPDETKYYTVGRLGMRFAF